MISFIQTCLIVIQSSCTIVFIPPMTYERSKFSVSLPALLLSLLVILLFNRTVSQSALNFYFPKANDVEHLFICVFVICISTSTKCLLMCLAISKQIIINFFGVSSFSFHPFSRVFRKKKMYLILMKTFIKYLLYLVLNVISKISSLIPSPEGFLFSSKFLCNFTLNI